MAYLTAKLYSNHRHVCYLVVFFGILAINAATSLRDYPADKSLLATALAQSYPVSIVITLPALMGAFIAAPLISKEIENNTLQLALLKALPAGNGFGTSLALYSSLLWSCLVCFP